MERNPAFVSPEAISFTENATKELSRLLSEKKGGDPDNIVTILEFLRYNPDSGNKNSIIERNGLMIVEYCANDIPRDAIHKIDNYQFAVSIDLPSSGQKVRVNFAGGKFAKEMFD